MIRMRRSGSLSRTTDEEEDLYRFTAATAGAYVIETQGWTNVVMRLCGPDDPAK